MSEIIELKTSPNIRKRFLAALIDYVIINTICFFIIMTYGTPDENEVYHLDGWPALILILVWAFWTIGLEQIYGATLGNSIFKLKPKPLKNHDQKISFIQSLKRHLLDPIDMFFFGLIGYLTIKNTAMNQRLGDLWAETIVENEL
jgi:uncharacterized RDD family membrane protein YckC